MPPVIMTIPIIFNRTRKEWDINYSEVDYDARLQIYGWDKTEHIETLDSSLTFIECQSYYTFILGYEFINKMDFKLHYCGNYECDGDCGVQSCSMCIDICRCEIL